MNTWAMMIKLAKKKNKLKMTALEHQKRVSKSLSGKNVGTLVYHGLGSGKTFTSINASNDAGLPMVAIVPAALRANFRKEIKNSGYKGESEVISYEKATKEMNKKTFQDRISKSLVVFDEAHNMGGDGTTRSAIPNKLDPKKLLMLTGTPMRNRPAELVPLLLALKAKGAPANKKEFDKMFIQDKSKDPNLSIWKKLMNAMEGKQELAPKNLDKFKAMIEGKVDYHNAVSPEFYPSTETKTVEVPMDKKHLAIYSKMMGKDTAIRYKVEHDIPPNKMEISRMQNFLIGPRMASNTPAVVSDEASYADSAKIRQMIKDIMALKKKDKNFKGFVYSNFLGAGVDGMAEALKKKKIKYELFTGQMNDKQKKAAVDSYNKGDAKVLLVSGAGAEGIDLKGTKLVQIMEPHWNSARVNQAIGRAVRHKSHSELPKKEQHVQINKYVSTVPQHWLSKFLGFKKKQGVDAFMMGFASKKDELNKPFLDIMKGQ